MKWIMKARSNGRALNHKKWKIDQALHGTHKIPKQ